MGWGLVFRGWGLCLGLGLGGWVVLVWVGCGGRRCAEFGDQLRDADSAVDVAADLCGLCVVRAAVMSGRIAG
ncbi:hypothetical protein A4G31_09805 [Mycobacterium persicum]|nr:hypothetical protein A4G31_09805 [Mycobacterium persicum]